MANYLIVFASGETAKKVLAWAGEEAQVRVIAGGTLIAISNGRGLRPDGSFYLGHAIDHDAKVLSFSGGNSFAPAAASHLEGCYVSAQPAEGKYRIGADVFAHLPMLHFSHPGLAAISDLLFVLTQLRKHLGLRCKLDEEAVLARRWTNNFSSQGFCDRTIIQDILFSPPGATLTASPDGRIAVKIKPARELFKTGLLSYFDEIRRASERAVAVISTFLTVPDALVELALSGGQDLRMCLAAVMQADHRSQVRIMTNKSRLDDYRIVLELQKKYGFALNAPVAANLSARRGHRLERWFFSNAGIYDPLHAAANFPDRRVLNIGGQGTEIYRKNYGRRSIETVSLKVPDVGEAFRNQAERGISLMGIDRKDIYGSNWHFLGYRTSLHSGRSTLSSLVGIRPFMQKDLVGLGYSSSNAFSAPEKGAPSMVNDLTTVLSS